MYQHSKEEEFQGHWKTITDILISDAGKFMSYYFYKSFPHTHTHNDVCHYIDNDPDNGVKEITTHLDRMSDLICQEEYEKKGSMVSLIDNTAYSLK